MKNIFSIIGLLLFAILVSMFSIGDVQGQKSPSTQNIKAEVIKIDAPVINFQEQVPISVTLAIPDPTGLFTNMLTIPVLLDLNLKIDLSNQGDITASISQAEASNQKTPELPDRIPLTASELKFVRHQPSINSGADFSDVEGIDGEISAVQVDYSFGRNDTLIIFKRELSPHDLVGAEGIRFHYKVKDIMGEPNEIQVKLFIQDKGETQFALTIPAGDHSAEWQEVEMLFDEMLCWDPEPNCEKYNHDFDVSILRTKRLEFVIANMNNEDISTGSLTIEGIDLIRPPAQ